MSIRIQQVSRLLACMLLALSFATGCGLIYKQNIQQGNALEEEDLEQLYIGMNQRQVLFVLGSPSIRDPFLSDRWDYVQTFSRRGDDMVQRTVTLRFENDLLAEIIGVDQTPSMLVDESTLNDSVVVSSSDGEADDSASGGLDLAPTEEESAAETSAEEALLPEADVQGIGTPSAQEMEFEEQGDDPVSKAEQDYNYEMDELDEQNAQEEEAELDPQ